MRQRAHTIDAGAAQGSAETQVPVSARGAVGLRALAMSLLLLGSTGCHHRRVQPIVLPAPTPVATIEVPSPANPPLIEQPNAKLPTVPVAAAAGRPKRVRKRTVKAATPSNGSAGPAAGTQIAKSAEPSSAVAETPEAQVSTIGALTVGGEQSPRALQDASDLIAANERRLSTLNADTAKAQAALVGKVRNFQKDAQAALTSGDAEGAKTLATKGKLLLDDLDKPAAQ